METIIFILSIITLIIIGVVGVTITNRNIRDTYIAVLKNQLPDVARNIIENILSNEPDSITIEDIINFGNDYIPSDIYLSGIELFKELFIFSLISFALGDGSKKCCYDLCQRMFCLLCFYLERG